MTLAAVVLAAGSGTRMGGVAKALLRYGERTYLKAIVETAREAGTREIVVVVGAPFGDEVALHAEQLGVRVVENVDPARGMASSIALGFAALVDVDAAWLWPVDHPAVRGATLASLIAALGTHQVARPVCGDRGGHPPLVARTLFAELAACEGHPDGARRVIAAADVVNVVVDDRGVIRDVDTPDDEKGLA